MWVARHGECPLKAAFSPESWDTAEQVLPPPRCLCAGEDSRSSLWWMAARPGARRHPAIGSIGQRAHSPTPSLLEVSLPAVIAPGSL